MPAGTVDSIARDAEFPALALAASPSFLEPLFERTLFRGERLRARLQAVEVLNHKRGRRCTILYRLGAGNRDLVVIGKWHRDLEQARRLFDQLCRLQEAALRQGLDLALPVPLTFDPAHGLVLQEYAAGSHLRELVPKGDLRPFHAAGEWLAGLHELRPFSGLRPKTLDREVKKVAGWCAEIVRGLPTLEAELGHAQDGIEVLGRALPVDPVVIHRDYYPGNLIWDGERLWGLDFDQMALGDAGVDVGAFLAQMEKLVHRHKYDPEAVATCNGAFLAAYTARRPLDMAERGAFFAAYTFLKLAAAEAKRQREDWQEIAAAFVRRAGEEVNLALD